MSTKKLFQLAHGSSCWNCLVWAGIVVAFLSPAAMCAPMLHGTLLAALRSGCLATPEFTVENITTIHTMDTGRIPLWPTWSQNGLRIAFTATDPELMDSYSWLTEIWSMDLASYPAATRLLQETDNATCGCLAFVPDDSGLLFIQHVANQNGGLPTLSDAYAATTTQSTGITARALDPTTISGTIYHTDIRQTPDGPRIVVDCEKYRLGGTTTSLYVIPADASGHPTVAQAVEIVDDIAGLSSVRLALSPSGNELLFSHVYSGFDSNIALITGIDNIVAGTDDPITSWSDARVHVLHDGAYHADAPSWSEDGALFFYGYDFQGNFRMSQMNFDEADFDLMIGRLEDVLAGNLIPTQIQIDGDQGCVSASPGGTRIVFGETASPNNRICSATLRISDTLSLDSAGVVQTPFALADGSGTTFNIAVSTTLSNHGATAGPVKISVFTPVSPIEEAALAGGTQGVPVVRNFSYENLGGNPDPQPLTLTPAAALSITYSDAEIEGLDEDELAVYQYNPSSGLFDLLLSVISHDLDANRITVALSTIAPAQTGGAKAGSAGSAGSLGIGIVDSDGDGISDGRELRWDGDPGTNVYDKTTNPAGTDLNPYSADTDGDGVRDSTEIAFNMNPLFAGDGNNLPASNTVCLGLLTLVLAYAGARFTRKRASRLQ